MLRVTGRPEHAHQQRPWGYGDTFDESALPPTIKATVDRIRALPGLRLGRLRDVTLNWRHSSFLRLDPHLDPDYDGENIFILSVDAPAVLTLSPYNWYRLTRWISWLSFEDEREQVRRDAEKSWTSYDIDVLVTPGALLHLSGDARWKWAHGTRLGVELPVAGGLRRRQGGGGGKVGAEEGGGGAGTERGGNSGGLLHWFGRPDELFGPTLERHSVVFAFAEPDAQPRPAPSPAPSPLESPSVRQSLSCPICCDLLLLPVVTPCGHAYCQDCFETYRHHASEASDARPSAGRLHCPMCRGRLPRSLTRQPLAPCTALADSIAALCPRALRERQLQQRQHHNHDEQQQQRPRGGAGGGFRGAGRGLRQRLRAILRICSAVVERLQQPVLEVVIVAGGVALYVVSFSYAMATAQGVLAWWYTWLTKWSAHAGTLRDFSSCWRGLRSTRARHRRRGCLLGLVKGEERRGRTRWREDGGFGSWLAAHCRELRLAVVEMRSHEGPVAGSGSWAGVQGVGAWVAAVQGALAAVCGNGGGEVAEGQGGFSPRRRCTSKRTLRCRSKGNWNRANIKEVSVVPHGENGKQSHNVQEMVKTGASLSGIDVQSLSCPICCDLLLLPVVTPCGHAYCQDCFEGYRASRRIDDESSSISSHLHCPMCRHPLSQSKALAPCIALADSIAALCPRALRERQLQQRQHGEHGEVEPAQRLNGEGGGGPGLRLQELWASCAASVREVRQRLRRGMQDLPKGTVVACGVAMGTAVGLAVAVLNSYKSEIWKPSLRQHPVIGDYFPDIEDLVHGVTN
ncbi:hypothetical protein VOLCADRAFT_89537 [Volvox carteri f. nagariensis]|uniref:RING-type domain-containing protein n=1 Tax=Volvox carteri f. nagariensis TaxID=3068 RepID=D8TS38_VOLCA|nr:uncharacterized protein VOLCADRAFT_89537 [Volvox carteri f. nagariensis]EFJ49625.1 hypothetical protein VOLCADRAFT_89537 [Volvox carteri f. nagariensis]|eukprot:XP_002949132.1 hypothetical protein VOLCADRAFT_89537 [Volvox carteri f. nagariensis]